MILASECQIMMVLLPPQAKRQAGAPRVYKLTKEVGEDGNFNAIPDMLFDPNYLKSENCIASCLNW